MKKILLILFLLSHNVFADNISDSREFVANIGNAIVTFNDKDRLIKLMDQSIYFQWISRFVFGKNYRKFDDNQKKEFTNLYREFLINAYGPKFDNYKSKSFKITSIEEKKRYVMVKSELEIDDGTKVAFAFRIKRNKSNNQFKIIDVIVEKVSLIETQRSEFSSAISQNGVTKFLKMMQEKINNQKLQTNDKK